MKRLLLYSVMIAATGLLAACEEPTVSVPPVDPSPVKSYSYRADPPVYEQQVPVNPHVSAMPTLIPQHNTASQSSHQSNTTGPEDQTNNLPVNTESASQKNAAADQTSSLSGNAPVEKDSVQGFPPGHPLYRDNTNQNSELSQTEPSTTEPDLAASPAEPTSGQSDESAVPSQEPSDNAWPQAQPND